MNEFLFLPLVLQPIFILIDEFYFHLKRRLPRWERIGHPLDTLTFLACFGFTLIFAPTQAHIQIFLGLAVFTCIFVTKDEFVHARHCSGGEQWVHSILFILHPASLITAYRFWVTVEYHFVIVIQTLLMAVFMLWQIFYWQNARRFEDAKS
jgi:hypothetical protein